MSKWLGFAAPRPEDLVCTFTANVCCPSCGSALLLSWRAEDTIHPSAQGVMGAFRRAHHAHPFYCEGLPAIGIHAEPDTFMSGTSILSLVRCEINPAEPSNMVFTHTGPPTQYSQ